MMTREKALEMAQQFGNEVYMGDSESIVDGVRKYQYFFIHIDGLYKASAGSSWEECLERIAAMNPIDERRKKADRLRKELATLEGEAA